MAKATTTSRKLSLNKVTTLANNLIQPQGTTIFTSNMLNKIQTYLKNFSNYFDKTVAPKIRRFSRKFILTLLIWCSIGIAALLVAETLPSFMEDYPAVYNTATFGLKFSETFFTYISTSFSDIIEIFKNFTLLSPVKALVTLIKNLSIFGNLL